MSESEAEESPLQREARRVYLRYARELVEGLGFCPWAEQARQDGRVALRVIEGAGGAEEQARGALAQLSCDEGTDIGLLIFPELRLDRGDFARFTAALREADSERMGRGNTVFALADFHPNVEADLESPERLVPFIRRSPDPTIQCVRRSALDAVRLGGDQGTKFLDVESIGAQLLDGLEPEPPPLHQRVARANLRTIEQRGLEQVRALMDDILRDRDASYAKLGIPPPPWSHLAADTV